MKTLFVFFLLSISAFSAPWGSPSASELKIRKIWADHYKKEGYDFDIQKMSQGDMYTAYNKAKFQKKLAEEMKVEAARKKVEAAREAQVAEQKRVMYLKERDEIFKKEGVSLSPKEIELRKLEAESKRLYELYKQFPNGVNEGRWKQALDKALELKWQMYPSLRPTGSSRSKLDDVEAKLDEISEKLDQE